MSRQWINKQNWEYCCTHAAPGFRSIGAALAAFALQHEPPLLQERAQQNRENGPNRRRFDLLGTRVHVAVVNPARGLERP
jgi:hypothetical protein